MRLILKMAKSFSKFFIIFSLIFYPSKLMAIDYSKLPTIEELLFSINELQLTCFYQNKYLGMLVFSNELKLIQFFGWKLENNSIRLDKSSKERLIKYPLPMDNLELHSLNLNDFTLKINHYDNIDLVNPVPPELLKAINERTIFDYFKMEQPSKVEELQCGVTWAFKIREIIKNDELRKKIVHEAMKESGKKECSGDHLKWDNCVAFREYYLGEYKDGWMSGHGIEFTSVSFGSFYIGNFVEDYKEGEGTEYFSAWNEDVEDFPQGKNAWTLKGLRIEGEWSDDNELEQYEALKKYTFFKKK